MLSSHQGRDFARIAAGFAECGYYFGALVIDAVRFVPQSRRRVFILGARENIPSPRRLFGAPDSRWHPRALVTAFERLDPRVASRGVWWSVPSPSGSKTAFADLIEDSPADVEWRSEAEINKLVSMMSRVNLAKVVAAQKTGRRIVGSIYKRTRLDEVGKKVQRAEVRFDDIAGCLRTPVGGSSRQSIILIEGDHIRSRLLSSREAARLMGLPDDFKLPRNYNEAYHLAGDGVEIPVVRHLAAHLIEPLIEAQAVSASLAAA
jgi:DNA (cytosine-5)-methyltransferase 1